MMPEEPWTVATAEPDDPVRVVVVDDVEAHRLLCALAIDLMPGMATVGEAADGAEACELVEQLQPDAVVLDLRMPVLDGFEAIPLLRTLAPHVRIVVWSGTCDPSDVERAVALGAHAVVGKLAEAREVAEAVRTAVDGYRTAARAVLVSTASRGALLHPVTDVRALRPWTRHLRTPVLPARPAALPAPSQRDADPVGAALPGPLQPSR